MNSIQSRQMDPKSEKDAYVWIDLINLPEKTNHTPRTKKKKEQEKRKK